MSQEAPIQAFRKLRLDRDQKTKLDLNVKILGFV